MSKNLVVENKQILEIMLRAFKIESYVMSRFIIENNVKTYIDFGCWLGYLSEMLLKKLQQNKIKCMFVDCTKDFVCVARERIYQCIELKFPTDNINFICATIIPETMKNDDIVIYVDNVNTLRTSIINTTEEGRDINNIVPTEICTIIEFIKKYINDAENVISDAYIKIDLEGIDIDVTADLLKIFKPKVIHFEILDFSEYNRASEILSLSGYHVPEFINQSEYYSIISSQNNSKLIGFNPDIVY